MTTMTPGETVYGSLKRYFSSRSGLIDTWLAMTSKRPASRPAKIASHWVSWNSMLEPELVGHGLGDLHVVADEVARAVLVVAERTVRALGGDGEGARAHEPVLVAGGIRAPRPTRTCPTSRRRGR